MFINSEIVAIAFRLINFGLLIGIVCFLYKKYIKTELVNMIEEQNAVELCLREQQIELESQQINLDHLLKDEATLCQNFRTKIDEWNKAVTTQNELALKKHIAYQAAAKKRQAHIAIEQENQRVQNIVISSVIKDLEESLSQDFQQTEHQKEYLTHIISFMDKRAS